MSPAPLPISQLRPPRRFGALLICASLCLGTAALIPPLWAQSTPVLRVGVVDGSQPCAWRENGVWQGLAVDLWNRIAGRERIAFVFSNWPSTQDLLKASSSDRIDVAIGCLNVSPDRLQRHRFSLPFQEDGLAVMVANSRLDLGRAFLGSLLAPTLVQLLGGYLAAIAVLSLLTWQLEDYGRQSENRRLGVMRSFSKLFQVLATGPGSNTIVITTRGNLLVIVAYLVRIVSASLLVGYLTVNVVRETQGRLSGRLERPADLLGLRVGVRRGSVSLALLEELNNSSPGPRARPVLVSSVREGADLLRSGRVDAVLADNLQLFWLQSRQSGRRIQTRLALEGIRPESQAFLFAPSLSGETADRINLSISALKRQGVVSELRSNVLGDEQTAERR